jgi:autotransporter-associated beta strand protein
MKPKFVSALSKSILSAAAWMVLATSAHAGVLYTMAGPQLVDETWNFAPPGLSLSRGAGASGTLYFKYTVTNPASNNTTESYYAGMSFFDGGAEHLGIGNGWNPWAYSAFSGGLPGGNLDLNSATPDPGVTYQQVRSTDTTTFVIRVDFNSGANDNITVWLNPNLSLPEAAQNPALKTTFTADANFDTIYLREGGGGGGWTYSDFAIAEYATDAGFFAVPLTTSTWDGGGVDSNWSTAANWLGDTAPAAGFDLIFPNSPNTSPVNDLTAGTAFTGLNFDSGATSYTLTGNAIGISNFVRNTSVNPQTVEMPLELNGPLALDALNSTLSIGGAISGPHGITKTGNRVDLTANNSYTGDTTITTGTLSIGDGDVTGSIDPTGTVAFGAGATTRLEIFRSDDVTMGNPITTGGRANIAAQGGGKVNLTGPITGAGEFWTHGPGTVQITPNVGSAGYATSVVVATGTLEVADFTTSTLGTGGFFIGEAGSGTLRYTGPSTSTDRVGPFALQGTGTNTFIEVVSAATELTFTQPLDDNDPFGPKGLTKTGPGTLVLGVAHVYGGDTVIDEGELHLAQPGFADTSTVTVGDNGQLRLNFAGSDTVTGIVFGPNTMGPGTYTEVSHPDYISGPGSLVIPSTATDYENWETANGVTGGVNDDDDNDGLTNHEEYAFGLDPTGGSSVNPIAVPFDKALGTFSYTRRDLALQDPDLSYTVWYSTDLANWFPDNGAVQGPPVDNGDEETVPVTISEGLLSNSKLFIQVRAE